MMRRKHLERAVLLSLLLANVCRVGGATEYSTTITGQESGYDSIKVVDPATGEITKIRSKMPVQAIPSIRSVWSMKRLRST